MKWSAIVLLVLIVGVMMLGACSTSTSDSGTTSNTEGGATNTPTANAGCDDPAVCDTDCTGPDCP